MNEEKVVPEISTSDIIAFYIHHCVCQTFFSANKDAQKQINTHYKTLFIAGAAVAALLSNPCNFLALKIFSNISKGFFFLEAAKKWKDAIQCQIILIRHKDASCIIPVIRICRGKMFALTLLSPFGPGDKETAEGKRALWLSV